MVLEKTTSEVAGFKIFLGCLLALLFLFFHWVFVNFIAGSHFIPGRGTVNPPDWLTITFIWIYRIIAILVVSYHGYQAFSLIRNGGKWVITVTSKGIEWLSPSQQIEASFFLPLEEIDFIGTKQRFESHRRGSDKDFIKVLVKKDGSFFKFTNECCVDLELIYTELMELGVPFRDTKFSYESSEVPKA